LAGDNNPRKEQSSDVAALVTALAPSSYWLFQSIRGGGISLGEFLSFRFNLPVCERESYQSRIRLEVF